MSSGSWRIKPSELQRTLESIRKAGLHVKCVEVIGGAVKINVVESETDPDTRETEDLRKLL
jgi:hypothetical protein